VNIFETSTFTYCTFDTGTLTASPAGGICAASRMGCSGSFARVAATGAGVSGGAGDFAGESFGEGGVHFETAKAD
jgi:hypothetical protein